MPDPTPILAALPDATSPTGLVLVAVLGLVAGLLGGMLGVGGSVIMIPGLSIIFGPEQHLYQAAAMIANVAVAVPAAARHHKAGAIVPKAIRWMLPAALLFVLVGVWASNLPAFGGKDGQTRLSRLFALLLVYVIIVNVRRLFRKPGPHQAQLVGERPDSKLSPPRCLSVGAVMGAIAGFLGVGGGAIAVPLQQLILKLPLRSCIANSAAVICISAAVGAVYKNATLHALEQPMRWQDSVTLALLLAPTCVIGGHLGAILTHKLPVRQVRIAFILLMIAAAWRMARVPWETLFG
jgi:hypothetical protein